jgi:hypothetical protein
MAVNGIGQTHSAQTEHANAQSPSRAQNGGAKAAAPNATVKQAEAQQAHGTPTAPAAAAENNSGREQGRQQSSQGDSTGNSEGHGKRVNVYA